MIVLEAALVGITLVSVVGYGGFIVGRATTPTAACTRRHYDDPGDTPRGIR